MPLPHHLLHLSLAMQASSFPQDCRLSQALYTLDTYLATCLATAHSLLNEDMYTFIYSVEIYQVPTNFQYWGHDSESYLWSNDLVLGMPKQKEGKREMCWELMDHFM